MLRAQSATFLVAIALLLGGCAAGEPIVPSEISTMVNDQGRERTYDLAWQDIRRFEGALRRGENADYGAQALVILSRMNRLAEGKAGGLKDTASREYLDLARQTAAGRDAADLRKILEREAVLLRESFDVGDFRSAQSHALQALGLARALGAFD